MSGVAAIVEALDATGAIGFVHVSGDDPARRYLTRTDRPQRETAVVVVRLDGDFEAIYCLPESAWQAANTFLAARRDTATYRRAVTFRAAGTTVASQLVSVLSDRLGADSGGSLLAPRRIPHDTALELTDASYTLSSTTALDEARARKSPAERDRMAAVQRAVAVALDHGVTLLDGSEVVDGMLTDGDTALSGRRVETEIRVALARSGVDPARVGVRARPAFDAALDDRSDALPAGTPIEIHVSGRGPHGYYGRLSRTLVVDSDGGWDRRAFVACEAGLRAGLRHCRRESSVHTVRAEALAEIAAYGFSPAESASSPELADSLESSSPSDSSTDSPDGAMDSTRERRSNPFGRSPGSSARVFGIGLAAHEAPSVDDSGVLAAGSTVALETSVFDPTHGRIRLGTVGVVAETTETRDPDETDIELVSYPYALTPEATRGAIIDAERTEAEGTDANSGEFGDY